MRKLIFSFAILAITHNYCLWRKIQPLRFRLLRMLSEIWTLLKLLRWRVLLEIQAHFQVIL